MKKDITIVTHSSKCHADDVFAVATLSLLFEKEHNITVVRSRIPEVIATGDFVVDVGGIYDPEKNLFDHHQEGGAGARPNGVQYASFGLVWKKYGAELCGNQEVVDEIDVTLVQPVDLYDNGVQFNEPNIPGIYPYDLKMMMRAFSPTWKEEDMDLDELFMTMVSYAKVMLARQIVSSGDALEGARLVREAYDNAEDKRCLMLDERYPWEEVLEKIPEVLFVVYPKRVDNTWSLKTVGDNRESYLSRKDLPASWAGKRGGELEQITGVPGAMFCHNNRFLVVAKTKEAILRLAKIALESEGD